MTLVISDGKFNTLKKRYTIIEGIKARLTAG